MFFRERLDSLFFIHLFSYCDNFSKLSLLYLYHTQKNQILIFHWGFGGEATKLSYRWLSKLEGCGWLAIRFWVIVDTITELAKAEKGRFEAFRKHPYQIRYRC